MPAGTSISETPGLTSCRLCGVTPEPVNRVDKEILWITVC